MPRTRAAMDMNWELQEGGGRVCLTNAHDRAEVTTLTRILRNLDFCTQNSSRNRLAEIKETQASYRGLVTRQHCDETVGRATATFLSGVP